jgi:hypothetical protein
MQSNEIPIGDEPTAASRRRTTTVAASSLAVLLAAGVWLFLAPFLFDYQSDATAWVTATKNHVATGVVLVGASLVSLLGFVVLAVRDAVRRSGA